jgi:hypothetical protein
MDQKQCEKTVPHRRHPHTVDGKRYMCEGRTTWQ